MDDRKKEFDISMYAAAIAASMNNTTLNAQINESTFAFVATLDPLQGTKLITSLFYAPEFQSNVLQLEGLVHLVLAKGSGKKKLRSRQISKLLKATKGTSFEYNMDPAEGFMSSVVYFRGSKFNILEGIYEGNSFFLQRMLNTLEATPDTELTSRIKSSIEALLEISDYAYSLTDLSDHEIGHPLPIRNIKSSSIKKARNYATKLSFNVEELESRGIDLDALSPFVFDLDTRSALADSLLGASPLEVTPLLLEGDSYYLILPTAIGAAIRTYFISRCEQNNLLSALNHQFQLEYIRHFSSEIPILGELSKLGFRPVQNDANQVVGADTVVSVDPGKYLLIVFQFDDFEGFEPNYVNNRSPNTEAIGAAIDKHIGKVSKTLEQESDFRKGICLVILAGWGRAVMGLSSEDNSENWRREYTSAHDLETFSILGDISVLKFWRFVEAIQTIEELGIHVSNINGLLNMYGHLKANDYLAFQNDSFGKDDVTAADVQGLNLMIATNFIRDVRIDAHRVAGNQLIRNPSGECVRIARQSRTAFFKEDRQAEIYASVSDLNRGILVGLVKGNKTNWWLYPETSDQHGKDFVFKAWEANCKWVERIARAFDDIGNIALPDSIIWEWSSEDLDYAEEVPMVPSKDELQNLVSSTAKSMDDSIHIRTRIHKGFSNGFHQENNDAECALVTSFLEALISTEVFNLDTPDVLPRVMGKIFTSPDIKHIHMFVAQDFRDYIKKSLPLPVLVDEVDIANIKMGLGWLARNSDEGNAIRGRSNCTAYLQKLVHEVWLKMRDILQSLNKDDVVNKMLLNHESIQSDAKNWRRTNKSNLASHVDKLDAKKVVTEQIGFRNSGSVSSRIVLEMAICECSDESGGRIGRLEMSRLCAYAAFMFQLGNSSDAIHHGLIPAKIKISPLGDVLFDQNFQADVIDQYGNRVQTKFLKYDADTYSRNFKSPDIVGDISPKLDAKFVNAWLEEYEIGIDDLRRLIDAFENDGISNSTAVLKLSENEINKVCQDLGLDSVRRAGFLEHFVLRARSKWTDIPDGIEPFHIMPWRFKRDLSLYRRPIIFYNETYYVTPGMLREGFSHFLSSCYDGTIPAERFSTPAMRSWVGTKRKEKGLKFNLIVEQKFKDLGWQAKSEKKLDDLLNRKLDQDYGDVDVVAWNASKNILLIIECKSLEFAKTEGDVARQISEFRGQAGTDGKPDRLLKHVKRIEVLMKYSEDLLKKLELSKGRTEIIPCIMFSEIVPISHTVNENRVLADTGIKVYEFDEIETLTEYSQ